MDDRNTGRRSRSGIPLKNVYTPEDIKEIDYSRDLNSPGSFPFTRGRRSGQSVAWIQRELSGEGDPERSNQQFKYLIENGQTGLDVIGDSPTMACLDPDHPLAANTVGTQGVSLCRAEDFRELLADIPLDTISISTSLPPFLALPGLYLAAEEQGNSAAKLRGSILQPPFFAEDCGYANHIPFPLRLRLTCDSIAFCGEKMPKFHSYIEDTYFFSESGLNAIEEMALGFIEIRYVAREMIRRGQDIDSFAPRIAILLNCSMDFFEEIAKIRAVRRVFAKMMRDEFGAKDPRSLAVVITSHTSGLSLTAQQPFGNIVRGAIQALALALAGVQALEISAFDEGYRTPSPESHLVGLRTQQILQLETHITSVQDPLGGSYFIESLTNELESGINKKICEIEEQGDPAELAENGWFKQFFEDAMERYNRQVGEGNLPKVGLNVHTIPEEEDTLLKNIAEEKIKPYRNRIESIKKFKQKRNHAGVKRTLRELRHQAEKSDNNLIPPIINAMKNGSTFGEIAGTLRQAGGAEYDPHGFMRSPVEED